MKFQISKDEKIYPSQLKSVSNSPKILYLKGDKDPKIFEKCLAVVGSRKMSSYGRYVCKKLVSELAPHGITIVSGFMYGIDALAHKTAVDSGGKTIAVMPCGIDRIHPYTQYDLYQEILDNKGLVISEYPSREMPRIWSYPRRNRIVAGLSRAVLIIEASINSGSLMTANIAHRMKKPIFCVPGPINSVTSEGCNLLIKEKRAQLIDNSAQLRALFGIDGATFVQKTLFDEDIKNKMWDMLSKEPMSTSDVCSSLPYDTSYVIGKLNEMKLMDYFVEERGVLYVNKS